MYVDSSIVDCLPDVKAHFHPAAVAVCLFEFEPDRLFTLCCTLRFYIFIGSHVTVVVINMMHSSGFACVALLTVRCKVST